MKKRIRTIIPESQQEISTKIDRDGGDFVINVNAAPELEDELRSEFHDAIDTLGSERVSVRSHTRTSNQGDELFQIVTVRFSPEDQLEGIETLAHAIEIGKDAYYTQLDQALAGEGVDEPSDYTLSNQQLTFGDDEGRSSACCSEEDSEYNRSLV